MDLSVQQLRMLREVDIQGTIAAAASHLGYSASAVSQQLATIEKVTGVAVLERSGRNVLLTDPGRELVKFADVILLEMEKAKAAMERAATVATGKIKLGVMESIGSVLLPNILWELNDQHPEMTLHTQISNVSSAMDEVRSGAFDAAFVLDYPDIPSERDANVERILTCYDWFKLVVPENDEFVGTVDLEELKGRPMIAAPPQFECGFCVTNACREAGFEPNLVHALDDFPVALRMVAAGAGVSLIPDLALHTLPEGVRVLELKNPFARKIELVYRKSSADRPSIRALIEAMNNSADRFGLDRAAPPR